MFKPGNSFTDYFFIATAFLPLLPAILILFQKNSGKEPFHLLLIICLVDFIRDLPMHLYMQNIVNQNVINNICYLIELVLLTCLFKPILTKNIRNILAIILVAFISSLLTWLSVKGWNNNSTSLATLQNGMLIGMILLSLPPLVRAKGLDIFQSSLFWIAGGTLFYLLILLLLEWLTPGCILSPDTLDTENRVFLSLAALIRYLLYTLAVLPGRDEIPAEEKPSF